MTVVYFDCFSGAAGDMVLGALIDAGVPFDAVRDALGSLALDRDAVRVERVLRAGLRATRLRVRGEDAGFDAAAPAGEPPPGQDTTRGRDDSHSHAHGHEHAHDHGHGHAHDHDAHAHSHADDHRHGGSESHSHSHSHSDAHAHDHEHRTLAEIFRLVDRSRLSGDARDRVKALFTRLGTVEAEMHDTTLDRVHLHEVGALDSIIDIVGTVHALELTGARRFSASPLNVGSGMVRSAHGLYPVPAPATVRLLEGVPIYAGAQVAELVTPTGALLVTGYATSYGPPPAMRLSRSGYGAGTRDFPDTPNVLRVLVGDDGGHARTETIVNVECEIDDMNPQVFGPLMDRLFGAGALDVFFTPVQMKKNRPGTLVSVLVPPALREAVAAVLFRETTSIGVRWQEMQRECLARERVQVETPFGPVHLKVARRDGAVMNVAPEFDDCLRLAETSGRPVKDVQAAALHAYMNA